MLQQIVPMFPSRAVGRDQKVIRCYPDYLLRFRGFLLIPPKRYIPENLHSLRTRERGGENDPQPADIPRIHTSQHQHLPLDQRLTETGHTLCVEVSSMSRPVLS